MIAVKVLGLDDRIQAGDLVRYNHSYREGPDPRLYTWVRAEKMIPAWIGQTLRKFYQMHLDSHRESIGAKRIPYNPSSWPDYQVIRVHPKHSDAELKQHGFIIVAGHDLNLSY